MSRQRVGGIPYPIVHDDWEQLLDDQAVPQFWRFMKEKYGIEGRSAAR